MKNNVRKTELDNLRKRLFYLMTKFLPGVSVFGVAEKMKVGGQTVYNFVKGLRVTRLHIYLAIKYWVEQQEKQFGITPETVDEDAK